MQIKHFKVIKFLCAIEKAFNIHRDYLFLSKRKRFLTTLIILFDIVISAFIFISNVKFITRLFVAYPVHFIGIIVSHVMFGVNNLLVMIYFAPMFGSYFKNLLSSLYSCHEIVKCHPPYTTRLNKLKIHSVVAAIVLAVVRVIFSTSLLSYTFFDSRYRHLNPFPFIFFEVFETCAEARFALGSLMFYFLLAILRSILQSVTALLRELVNTGPFENLATLNSLATVYRQGLESSRQLKACFGRQVNT